MKYLKYFEGKNIKIEKIFGYEIYRMFSITNDLDPYSEENWDEENLNEKVIEYLKPIIIGKYVALGHIANQDSDYIMNEYNIVADVEERETYIDNVRKAYSSDPNDLSNPEKTKVVMILFGDKWQWWRIFDSETVIKVKK